MARIKINKPGASSNVNIIVGSPTLPPESLVIPMLVQSGESNSGGQALNSAASAPEVAVRPETKILNNDTLLFESLDIGTNNLIGHANMSTPTLRHSWELEIGNQAASGSLRNPTYVVKTGQGGTTIANWADGATYSGISPWAKFQERVDAALTILNPSGIKFGLLYSQGINDGIAGTNINTWETDTLAHFAKIRAKYGNVPIVMTKIMSTAPSYTNYNSKIEAICAAIERCYFVEVEDAGRDDIYHWSYSGQKLIAQRMIQKLKDNNFILT